MKRFFRPAKIARQSRPVLARFALAGSLLALTAAGAGAVELVAHTAHYKMTLVSARSGSNIHTVGGHIVVRWNRDCSGWAMTNRTAFNVGYGSGQAVRVSIDAATWESLPGDKYTFLISTRYDGRQAEQVEGSATLTKTSRVADFVLPKKKRVALSEDTVFPQRHTELVLDAARKAPGIVRATVFDGFTEGGSQFVNAVVGAPSVTTPGVAKKFPQLQKLNSWIVNLAYFPGDAAAAEPDSEISTKMTETGIAEWMDMDFGDFRVRGDLENLKIHKSPTCE